MRRKSPAVILLNKDRFAMSGIWTHRIELTRLPRCRFNVTGSKDLGRPTDQLGNLPITHVDGITSPRALYRALNNAASILAVEMEWVHAIPLIAQLDWITAAVIANDTDYDVPKLPPFETVISQRLLTSIRGIEKVKLGAELGYDMHELTMSFEEWLRILGGETDRVEKPYFYEGKRCLGDWKFDVKGGLVVGIDYEGERWGGRLADLAPIDSPKLENADLAKLAVRASSATKSATESTRLAEELAPPSPLAPPCPCAAFRAAFISPSKPAG